MKKWLVVFFSIVGFVYLFYPIILPSGQPTGSYAMIPDAEGEFLTTLRMSRGEGWYSSFSYVYPPGKFIVRAILFSLIGPTFATGALPMLATTWILFPTLLFVLSVFFSDLIISALIRMSNLLRAVISYVLACVSVFLYLSFFRSAQEVHLIIAAFILILLLTKQIDEYKKYLLGLLWGFTFLFRIDAGIVLSVALVLSQLKEIVHLKTSFGRKFLAFFCGFLTVWIPVIGVLIFHGSLKNFVYDTLILGLIVQPKFMSLPIPDNQFGLFYLSTLIFLLAGSISMFLFAQQRFQGSKQIAIRVLAVVCILSYVSVLGRSDEPHLWYGLIWLPIIALFSVIQLYALLREKMRFSFRLLGNIVAMSAALFLCCWQILYFKNPALFLIEIIGFFVLLHFTFFTKISIRQILLSGLLTSLITFHSLHFLQLKMMIPHLPVRSQFMSSWLQNDPGEIGGVVLDPQSRSVLDQIRADIPEDEKHLFIFPKNVFLNEYFHLTNPTRYTLLSLERSQVTEHEIIEQLQKTQTQYFLIFLDSAQLREGPVWQWILDETRVAKTYSLGNETVELRKKDIIQQQNEEN